MMRKDHRAPPALEIEDFFVMDWTASILPGYLQCIEKLAGPRF